ncbi:MAG TPA: serine/threonine-protein kinase [Polyangiaceae bacterium]|nr:serine/threonine-protein kinase [Polyangiaceae bacterium]
MVSEDLVPGTQVGEYVIERVLGEGSFGKVYAAVHPLIGKAVAVKVLDLALAARSEHVSRFVEEARAVNRIRHRHIVDIFAFGQLPDGRHYFVMELLEGKTLREYLDERKRVPLAEALPILRKVARALDAAHAAGIAHRDLKPDNLFLSFDEDGNVFPKLLDFGIAKLTGDAPVGGHRTATGVQMGTPLYMSPEQCRGSGVDHRTDIYAFGVLVFEMLAGRTPFDDEAVVQIIIAHMSRPAPPLSSVAPDLPRTLDGPVMQMLDKDPARRPQSVSAAVDGLEQAARQSGISVPSRDIDGSSVITPPPVDPKFAATVAAEPAQLTQPSPGQPRPTPAPQWPQHVPPRPPMPEPLQTPMAQPMPQAMPQPMPMPMHAPMHVHTPVYPSGSLGGHAVDSDNATNRNLWIVVAGCGALFMVALVVLAMVALFATEEETPEDAPAPSASTAVPDKAVQFAKGQVPAVGAVTEIEESMRMDLTVVKNGVKISAQHRLQVERSHTVMQNDDERVTRAEVTFRRREEVTTVNGAAQTVPSTVVGKTFVVSSQGVERSDGTAVTAAEKKTVSQAMAPALEPNVLAKLLGGKALDIGDSMTLDSDLALELLGGNEDSPFEATGGKLTLRAVDRKVATFDVQLDAEVPQGGFDFEVKLSGTRAVQIDTLWPVAMELRGPLKIDDPALSSQSGSLSLDAKIRYR